MTSCCGSARPAEDLYERVARCDGRTARARMMGAAGAVHLAGSNTGNPQARTFRTPDRSITVPDARGRADERLSCSNDGCSDKAKHVDASLAQRPAKPEHSAYDVEHAFFETAPAGVGRVVAEDRYLLALRLDRDPFDAQHVVHAKHIDPVA